MSYTNAGDSSSLVLNSFRERALAKIGGATDEIGYFEWSAPTDEISVENARHANPAMGITIHEDNVRSVLQDPPDVVMTEVLCRWVVALNSAVDAQSWANCLDKEFGQRPIIFYSNGFQTWIWDDMNYPPREVFGFYKKDELQRLIQRRSSKEKLANLPINNDITDRYYQHEAIRKISEALENNHREALIVMATGTGKTRVAASLIDFLSKANLIKRVLFLADRNALVRQAKKNLNNYLPSFPAVDLTKEKEDDSSRIVFSTYQTMINLIDGETDYKNRLYSIGHFDLIIFDEIHRSVYNRYRAIFKY
jgi:type I site-specific restriction endonuclease